MDLKRGIDLAAKAVIADVEKQSKNPSSEIAQVGTVSANEESEIGSMKQQQVGNEVLLQLRKLKHWKLN